MVHVVYDAHSSVCSPRAAPPNTQPRRVRSLGREARSRFNAQRLLAHAVVCVTCSVVCMYCIVCIVHVMCPSQVQDLIATPSVGPRER